MEYGIIGLVVVILDLYAIYKTLTSAADTMAKLLWTIGILVFPVIGFIVWLLAGPKGGRAVTV